MLLDIIQDYFRLECKCYDFCVIQNGCPTLFCPLSSAFMRKYWSSKVVNLSVIISADFYRTQLTLKIYLPAELELLLFCFTRSRIIVNKIIGLLSTDFRISASSMLCTLSVQTLFFTLCDDNLKMRRNLPAETIQIGVTEVFGQVQQTYIFNQSRFTRLFSTTSDSISSHNSGNCGLLRRQNIEANQHKNIHLVL